MMSNFTFLFICDIGGGRFELKIYFYIKNRNVDTKLYPQQTNKHDKCALGFALMSVNECKLYPSRLCSGGFIFYLTKFQILSPH